MPLSTSLFLTSCPQSRVSSFMPQYAVPVSSLLHVVQIPYLEVSPDPLLFSTKLFVPWVRPYVVALSVQRLSCQVDNPRIGIQFPAGATCTFFTAFIPTLKPTQHFIQWATGVKRLGRESDHLTPSSAEKFMPCSLMKLRGKLRLRVRALACCFLCFHPAARVSTEYWGIGVTFARICRTSLFT
jgi:hypothetical protein